MAGLNGSPGTITARQQFAAVTWLRWRLFANGFRRKGGWGDLAARILAIPFALGFLGGPVVTAGGGAYYAASTGHLGWLTPLFWAVFLYQIVLSINIAPPAQSFDPQLLIRFPLAFPRYLAIRLVLGLLAVANVVGTLAFLAAAIGVTVAQPHLAPAAFAAAALLSLADLFFLRMVFAWVDRWLATRRSRELLTGLIVLISFGFQWANVTFNPGLNGHSHAQNAARRAALHHAYAAAQPYLHALPPGLAGAAVEAQTQGRTAASLSLLVAVAGFAALFLAVFAWRMRREFGGENLSEGHVPGPAKLPVASAPPSARATRLQPAGCSFVPSALAACLGKEWLYLRRNSSQFYALLAPLAMVVLFSARMGRFSHSGLVFPAAVAYTVLGLAALGYNSLGSDGAGLQFYLLAPVPFSTVLLAKNLFTAGTAAVELVLVYGVLSYLAGPPPLLLLAATVAWTAVAMLLSLTLGNWRSITAPKRIDPGKVARNQTSPLSAFLSLGVTVALTGAGAGLLLLASRLRLPWLPLTVMLALVAASLTIYRVALQRMNGLVLREREHLLEELTKAA